MDKNQIISLIQNYAWGAGIDPAIAIAQAQKESGFLPEVIYGPRVSSTGARGLMQFMPGTWQDFGTGSFDNAFDPDWNLTAWSAYMTYLLNRYGWDYRKALMGYYGGPGRVDKGTVTADIQNYADSILANAGRQAIVSYDTTGNPVIPDESDSIFGLSLTTALLIIGSIAAVWALKR